jgi:hypothetical protein
VSQMKLLRLVRWAFIWGVNHPPRCDNGPNWTPR